MRLFKIRHLSISILAIISMLLLSCKSDKMNNENPYQNQTLNFSYLALGDSYTIGQSVAEDERFPQQLAQKLQSENIVNKELRVIARTGWTTGELINAIEADKPEATYQLVTLLIGVNNQYRGLDTAQYRQQFAQLLQTAIGFAGGDETRVMVLSIPDYGVTPFAANMDTARIAREIDAFNAINLSETRKTSAGYYNITPISRQAATNPSLIAPDRLHPSGKMYSLWVEKLLIDANKIINKKS